MKLLAKLDAIERGLPRYFTGRACARGHIAERYVAKSTCVTCNNEASRAYRNRYPGIGSENVRRWKRRHPEAAKELYASAGRLWRYGITKQDFGRMLVQQGASCAICRISFSDASKSTRPHVDHDHATGLVRGLLCHHCNAALGHMKDSKTTAIAAARYLKRHDIDKIRRLHK